MLRSWCYALDATLLQFHVFQRNLKDALDATHLQRHVTLKTGGTQRWRNCWWWYWWWRWRWCWFADGDEDDDDDSDDYDDDDDDDVGDGDGFVVDDDDDGSVADVLGWRPTPTFERRCLIWSLGLWLWFHDLAHFISFHPLPLGCFQVVFVGTSNNILVPVLGTSIPHVYLLRSSCPRANLHNILIDTYHCYSLRTFQWFGERYFLRCRFRGGSKSFQKFRVVPQRPFEIRVLVPFFLFRGSCQAFGVEVSVEVVGLIAVCKATSVRWACTGWCKCNSFLPPVLLGMPPCFIFVCNFCKTHLKMQKKMYGVQYKKSFECPMQTSEGVCFFGWKEAKR